MATTKIKVYNTALRHLGITRLHSTDGLTENRQERREIDQVYDDSLTEMLEKAIWYFALKRVRMDADPEIETQFGRQFAYSQPDDMVDHGLHGITVDERGEQEIDGRRTGSTSATSPRSISRMCRTPRRTGATSA